MSIFNLFAPILDFLAPIIAPVIQFFAPLIQPILAQFQPQGGQPQQPPPGPPVQSAEHMAFVATMEAREEGAKQAEVVRQKQINQANLDIGRDFGQQYRPVKAGMSGITPVEGKGMPQAKLRSLANEYPLVRAIDRAFTHGEIPLHLSTEQVMSRFARTGWHRDETAAGRQVAAAWLSQRNVQAEAESFDFRPQVEALAREALQDQMEDILARMSLAASRPGSGPRVEDLLSQINTLQRQIDALADASPEVLMEQAFGYQIELPEGSTWEEQLPQLNVLAESNLAMLRYLDEVLGNTQTSSLDVFRRLFGNSGKTQIYLSANSQAEGAFYGKTPAVGDNLYLGESVTVATTVHEFGHVLDRFYGGMLSGNFAKTATEAGLEFRRDFVIRGFAATGEEFDSAGQSLNEGFSEIFADIFMTAVLHNQGYPAAAAPDYQSNDYLVGWHINPDGQTGNNAAAMQNLVRELFLSLSN